ncbi:MAG: peptidoglycan DD-metalloendopeptidase family protein [Clostridium sp.]|nr:peptidoglycan DD-metalloendopeptidase family protein [Clostridium sp.]
MRNIVLFVLFALVPILQADAQTNRKIKQLQNKKSELKKDMARKEKDLKQTRQTVDTKLKTILQLDDSLENRQKHIDEMVKEMNEIDRQVETLQTAVLTCERELGETKERYARSLRYARLNQAVKSPLLYAFSAQKATQILRRSRYAREYAVWQREQGESIKRKQAALLNKQNELLKAKSEKNRVMHEVMRQRKMLQDEQQQQRQIVAGLKQKEKTLLDQVAKQRKELTALDKKIDEMIAREIEEARKREEARKKAEAKRKAEAEARRKKAAEENARRVAEAKKAEQQALEAQKRARTAAEKSKADKNAAAARARTKEAEQRAAQENKRAREQAAKDDAQWTTSVDRKLDGSFEKNKGRLPVPITGAYRVGNRFGAYNVPGLKDVMLDNKGVNYIGQSGACARAIFNGMVTAVFQFGSSTNVLIRHGSYISVYCNLSAVRVKRGQKVSTRDVIGTVAGDGSGNNVLHFQLRHEKTKLNPEVWIGR